MGLNFIEKINTYNELSIDLQQIDSIIIFDNNLLEVETLKNKFNKEFLIIKTQKSIKEYIYFKKLKKNEQILVVINLNDDYNFCKKIVETLRKLIENIRALNISCYIIKNGSKYSNDIDNCFQALCIAEKKARYEYEILQKLMEENTENYLWFLMKKNYLVK